MVNGVGFLRLQQRRQILPRKAPRFLHHLFRRTLGDDLAAAIAAEHGYGPKVAQAVDRSHQVMGQLQKETLQHMFAMRAVLRPDQAAQFDAAVVRALTQPAR